MHWDEAQAVGVRGKSFVRLLASLKAINGNRLNSEFTHARVNVTSLGMKGAVLAPMFMTQSNDFQARNLLLRHPRSF